MKVPLDRSMSAFYDIVASATPTSYLIPSIPRETNMPKSPVPRIRRHDSPFSKEEEVWLVKRSAFMTATHLRRAYIVQFLGTRNHRDAPHRKAFQRLIKRFEESGGVTGRGPLDEQRRTAVTEENIGAVEAYFTDDPKSSIRNAADDLDLTYCTIWTILRKSLKWKAYRPTKVNRLTEANKAARVQFCQWFLGQPEGFEQLVCFSDEKWFVLHPSPNSQTDRYWAPAHPEEETVCRFQGDSKVMGWVALVDGKALRVRWMEDDEGRPMSVNGARYLAMVRDDVWPEIRIQAGRRRYWWMQDGATCHTTDDVLAFLGAKFGDRIISRRSAIEWPAYSPDLNVLDYWFWSFAMIHVRRAKPESLDELKAVVEDVAATATTEMIRNAVANLRRRCRACVMADGGHFESFLKSI